MKVTVCFTVENTEKNKFEILAKNKGISISELLRGLVESGLEKNDFDVFKAEIRDDMNSLKHDFLVVTEILGEMLNALFPETKNEILERVRKKMNQ